MKIVLIIVFIYVIICVYLYITQDSKIFQRKYATAYTPKIAKKINFTTSDGILLEGAITKNGDNLPLVLYFSGNANNVIEFLDKVAPKIKEYNFIGFNYPGYAGSEGKPCERCILKYALEIFDKYKPKVIIGRSLGSAVAAYVASKKDIKRLVLITPFDSVENIAKHKYRFLPIKYLLKHKFKEVEWIKRVSTPVSVLLSEIEDIVPKESVDNILANIPNLDKIYTIPNSTHGNILEKDDFIHILEKVLKN